MPVENRIAIAGSEKKPLADMQMVGPVPADEIVHATVVLRRRGDHPKISQDPRSYAPHVREEYGVIHGADPNDLQAIEAFAHDHNLTVSDRDASRRSIVVSGSAEAMQEAFGTKLHHHTVGKATYRIRTGDLSVPASIHSAVVGARPALPSNACRTELNSSSIVSTRVPSRSNRIARVPEVDIVLEGIYVV